MDIEQLVRLAVPVEAPVGHRPGGTNDTHDHVAVEVERDPTIDHVARLRHVAGLGQSMAMKAVVGGLDDHLAHGLDEVRLGRRHKVVEEGVAAYEALDPEELLGVERAVRPAMLRMALRRHAASSDVVHGDLQVVMPGF